MNGGKIMLQCPKCKSRNIKEWVSLTGAIWCVKCGFTVEKKEKNNPFQIDEKINTNNLLDQIQDIRAKNNKNWMDILKLAFKHAPDESKEAMERITKHDKEISSLCEKLSK